MWTLIIVLAFISASMGAILHITANFFPNSKLGIWLFGTEENNQRYLEQLEKDERNRK